MIVATIFLMWAIIQALDKLHQSGLEPSSVDEIRGPPTAELY